MNEPLDTMEEVYRFHGFIREYINATWFRSRVANKCLGFACWRTSSHIQGTPMNVWADGEGALLASGPAGAVIISCFQLPDDSFAAGAADLKNLLAHLDSCGPEAFFRESAPNFAIFDGCTEHRWSCREETHLAFDRSIIDAYGGVREPIYSLSVLVNDISKAGKLLASGLTTMKSDMDHIDVTFHPWGEASFAANGKTAPARLKERCLPNSLHLRLPVASFFGLFHGPYPKHNTQAVATLCIKLTGPDTAVLWVSRTVSFNKDGGIVQSRVGDTTRVIAISLATSQPGGPISRDDPEPVYVPTADQDLFYAAMGLDDKEPESVT